MKSHGGGDDDGNSRRGRKRRQMRRNDSNRMRLSGSLLLLIVCIFSSFLLSQQGSFHSVSALIPPSFIRRELRRTAGAFVGGAVVGGAVSTLWQQQQQRRNNNNNNDNIFNPAPNSLTGQVIFITGGTTGLGLETAKRLALGGPQHIILTARTHTKGQTAVHAIQDYVQDYYSNISTNSNNVDSTSIESTCPLVSYRLLDLDSLTGIREAVDPTNL
mmetsp:Transcript_19015/g.52100  ORF Transcript_19015/g.52100 Transcript_19015/m.52100 type:complete len:216 (-) Transcript_19015:1065-1712(-)